MVATPTTEPSNKHQLESRGKRRASRARRVADVSRALRRSRAVATPVSELILLSRPLRTRRIAPSLTIPTSRSICTRVCLIFDVSTAHGALKYALRILLTVNTTTLIERSWRAWMSIPISQTKNPNLRLFTNKRAQVLLHRYPCPLVGLNFPRSAP